MDIQQTDKESLAAYVHRFKWEANRCKFNNDAATIRIFLKGLKNAHTIATKVYEKGLQTLMDTIKDVEKLQAAQQITSTLLPTSSVNTMSSDNDKCFQCQKTSHMASYCPHIRSFDCNNYGHVAADCPDKIYHLQAHHHATEITPPVGMIDPHLGIIATPDIPTVIIEIGTGSVIPDPAHTTLDTGVTAAMTPTGVTPDCFIDLHIIALHAAALAHTATTMTQHIADPHPIEISPEMTAGPEHSNPASNIINQHKDLLQVHKQHLEKIRTEGTNRSQLTILPQNTIAQMSRIVTLRMI